MKPFKNTRNYCEEVLNPTHKTSFSPQEVKYLTDRVLHLDVESEWIEFVLSNLPKEVQHILVRETYNIAKNHIEFSWYDVAGNMNSIKKIMNLRQRYLQVKAA